MPEDKKKEELTVDIDYSGPDTEVEIKEEKTEGEVQDEKTTQDSDKPADTPAESDKPVDVRDSSDSKESDKKEEVTPQEQKKEMEEYGSSFTSSFLSCSSSSLRSRTSTDSSNFSGVSAGLSLS